jgi:hypothetical protein
MSLPEPRGPVSEFLLESLALPPHRLPSAPEPDDDPLGGEDSQLALYTCYELHYRSFAGVDDGWEWDPGLLALRARLERAFEQRVKDEVGPPGGAAACDMDLQLRALVEADDAPSVSRHLAGRGTLEEFVEFVVHRSAYHLKEADPFSWALPRIDGRAKAALVEIQADEYGGGAAERMHSELFRRTMEALGLDGSYGAYLDHIPGATLATVNLMSLFGLHRRHRGAAVGHLAVTEMTSTEPNRRYGNALRRLGLGPDATEFYDEHVEADAVHEQVAANDMAGGLARESPEMAGEVLFGARAMLAVDGRVAGHLMESWRAGRSSLRRALPAPAPAA